MKSNRNKGLTSMEIRWILYDVGNSAFILLATTILPIYFNYLAENSGVSSVDYLASWGYAASISTLAVAFIGPVFGALADTKGFKKPVFAVCVLSGVFCCGLLAIPQSWLAFLILFILAKIGYSSSLVFYDSMLGDITTRERMDGISSHGFAWGYIGSCIPFVISLIFVLFYESIGIRLRSAMAAAIVIHAVWWLAAALPLLRSYKQIYYSEGERGAAKQSLERLKNTIGEIRKNKKILLFLLAYFFYIDGVYTIIEMATAYGSALGLNTSGLLLALLVTQIVAFPFALLFGKASRRISSAVLIRFCIGAYFCIALYAVFLRYQYQFWILAICVGMFQGAIQALSRSYFAKIIPPQRSGEYFGIFDICGKGASFLGTGLMGIFAQVTENSSYGVAVLAVMFAAGFILFGKAAGKQDGSCKNTTDYFEK